MGTPSRAGRGTGRAARDRVTVARRMRSIREAAAEFDDRAIIPDTLAVKKENTYARSDNAGQKTRRR